MTKFGGLLRLCKKLNYNNFSTKMNLNRYNYRTSNNLCNCNDIKYCKYKCAGMIFLGGCMVEYHTFNNTKDINKSTGLGWGLLGAFLIIC